MKPLNNNVLVEIIREDDGVSRTDSSEILKRGRLIAASVSQYHLTASAGIMLNAEWVEGKLKDMQELVGKIVQWEEYAEGGQTFEENGKTYALIPWWRLIGFKEEE